MNDVVSAIQDDHRRIEVLLAALHDRVGREQDVRELYAALTAHTDAEETEVYPLIEDGPTPREEAVLAAHEAHARADLLVKSLLDSPPDSEDFDVILEELEEVITRHVEAEEEDLLPALAASSSSEQLGELAEAFSTRRADVLKELGAE